MAEIPANTERDAVKKHVDGEPITVIQSDGKANIILDMSSWDLFETCQFRYHVRHNLNRSVPISEKAPALDSGGLAHEGLETYFKGLQLAAHYNDRMHAAIMRMRVVSSDPEQCNLDEKESQVVMNAVEQSCEYWRFEDEQMEILEVERSFLRLIYEDELVRIFVSGKIDLLVNIKGIGRAASYFGLPIDHKTYSRDFEVPRLSNQFQNYCDSVGSNYLVVNRIGLQKTLKPEEKFKRVPLSYDQFILEDWRNNLIEGILNDYMSCVGRDKWRMNFTSCFKFNRKCECYEICETSGVENKLIKLEQRLTVVSPWDVTAKLKKD